MTPFLGVLLLVTLGLFHYYQTLKDSLENTLNKDLDAAKKTLLETTLRSEFKSFWERIILRASTQLSGPLEFSLIPGFLIDNIHLEEMDDLKSKLIENMEKSFELNNAAKRHLNKINLGQSLCILLGVYIIIGTITNYVTSNYLPDECIPNWLPLAYLVILIIIVCSLFLNLYQSIRTRDTWAKTIKEMSK